MRISAVTTLKNRSASTSKDGRMLNAFAENKGGVLKAVKRPSLVATFAALEGGAPYGQGMFAFSTPSGTQTLVGIQGDVLNNNPTPRVTRLAFTTQPVNWKINTAFSPSIVVAARDSFGNLITSYTGSVTLAFLTNPNGGTLSGTLTVDAVAGVATFSNVKIDRVGGGYKLRATASLMKPVTSSVFKIVSNLSFTVQPSTNPPNTVFDTPVEVSVVDSSSAVIAGYVGNVTIALASGPGSLSGTLTVAAVSGVATFADLQIDTLGTYTMVASASAGSLPNVISDSFVIENSTHTFSIVLMPDMTTYAAFPFDVPPQGDIQPSTFSGFTILSFGTSATPVETFMSWDSTLSPWVGITINGVTLLRADAVGDAPYTWSGQAVLTAAGSYPATIF